MRKIIGTAFVLIMIIQGTFAQQITIKGNVCNTNREPLEYINVVLQRADSVFVSGMTSDTSGRFNFQKQQEGDYIIICSAIGYDTQYLALNGVKHDIDTGNIILQEASVALEGVTISASNQITRSDRKLIFPSEKQLKVSTNGVNLLQELMLPRILVNPMNNEVTISGGGELQFRINGAKVELDEIRALLPENIIRIEYHDNPGLRYGNSEVVIDYIVHRPETGGNFGVNLSQGLNAMWGEHNGFGKVNHKKSEFGINGRIGPRDFYGLYRDNEEQFILADGTTVHRFEKGEPNRGKMLMYYVGANYNYQASEESYFSATFRMYGSNNPHWDYEGILYNTLDITEKTDMLDLTDENLVRPALDLYYQHGLKNKQTLVFNLVGTYNHQRSRRLYQESLDGELLTDIYNDVAGNRYSLIGEGIYEKQFTTGNTLSFGVKHTQTYSDNEYRNGNKYETTMNQGNSNLFGEYKGNLNKLNYRLGIGLTRFYYNQTGSEKSTRKYNINPHLMLHYNLSGNSYIRWRGTVYNSSPSLGDLSAVEQVVDSFQIRRGNPHLKSHRNYYTELTYEWKKGIFYSNLWGAYDYKPDVIMEEKFQEGEKIVQTWDNQRNWQKFSGRMMLRVGPVKEMLQLAFTGGVNHYKSNGNSYSHTYTNWFCEAQASMNYKKFSLNWLMNTNWNNFWGETLSGGENIQSLTLYYKHKDLRLGIGAFNPFTDNYKVESENRSEYASYKRAFYIKESSRLFIASLSYNFSFGRTFKGTQRKLNNSDNESGVMSTGK